MADQKLRARGIPAEWVEIEHDGIDGTTTVAPQSLPHWEARGWKAVKKTTPAARPAARTGSES